MYVAVLTEGPGAGTLTARWTYAGRLVSEDTQESVLRRSRGHRVPHQELQRVPAGDYTVEILLDGKSVETRNLRVEKEKYAGPVTSGHVRRTCPTSKSLASSRASLFTTALRPLSSRAAHDRRRRRLTS